MRFLRLLPLFAFTIALAALTAPAQQLPEWCRALPRPQYKQLQRVPVNDSWFEVYKVAPSTYAIYEPHQFQETIGYLILGRTRALVFDTGMGIGNLKKLIRQLTQLPIVVLNSHTHMDHVGNNWQFDTIYGMDTDFTRKNALGERAEAQEQIAPQNLCGALPAGFDAKAYSTRPWKITHYVHDGDTIDLGGRSVKIVATPGHTPDSISLLDAANGLLFTGDTYYPGTLYLFGPDTNLAAYETSIHRLAALAPQLREVLAAHNAPVSPPSVLPRLAAAFDKVRSGAVQPAGGEDGKALYRIDGFSFLMDPPK